MTPERILAEPPRVLPQQARIDYFEKGFALVEDAVPEAWIDRLLAVTGRMVEASRAERESGHVFDLAPEHSADRPRVRRIKRPDEQDEAYWAFVQEVLADIAADLLGPDVVFHHSKLNFKWFEGGDEVQWHQDIQFYPHTNYDHLTIGAYLADTGPENGPMSMLPGSHRGPLYDLYAPDGNWAGHLRAEDAASLATEAAETLTCRRGAVTIHNCRTLHYSRPSRTDAGRPHGPDAVRIVEAATGRVLDALHYEEAIPDTGEGSPAPEDATGSPTSIGRCPDGFDSDDNGADFATMTPTPGAANDCGVLRSG